MKYVTKINHIKDARIRREFVFAHLTIVLLSVSFGMFTAFASTLEESRALGISQLLTITSSLLIVVAIVSILIVARIARSMR